MTINDLFSTLDYSSYDKIIVHWPMIQDGRDADYHSVSFEYAEPIVELWGKINIMTMHETQLHDGGDASLFIHVEPDGVVIHIYLKREDVVHDCN